MIGLLVGLVLYEALGHRLRPLFWITVIPAVASAALVAAVRDPRTGVPGSPTRSPRRSHPEFPPV
ncbi:hypothetical protein [Streptomyces sp900105755]|uniref:Uncharacterized protein n=1 Tax=Streptomyces sp. 900105755 TaxID=3154389 RepID=A0ABV1TD34_9ACTN